MLKPNLLPSYLQAYRPLKAILLRLLTFVLIATSFLPSVTAAQEINGSGSTFAYPVVTKWSEAYHQLNGVTVGYQPIGSSAGVTEMRAGVVDFCLTDVPLVDSQLLRDGLAQFPVLIGAIVPAVNLDGITAGQLHFTGQLLADIYLGKVKNWSDAAIAAVNPGIALPNRPITVVYRTDGSGTTFNWTDFLSKVSKEWQVKVGTGTSVEWPVGSGGKGNGGVAANVARVKGSIGYVEYTYARRANLSYGLVQNQAGNFVIPDQSSFQAAIEGVDWAKDQDFYVLLNNSPAAHAYPIMATSFGLIRRYPNDLARSRTMLAFFRWAIGKGQGMVAEMDYLPLPASLAGQIEAYWQDEGR